ncbi:MAG: hypothetical protein PHP65_05630 [Bacilli bacterium]|nr:hypothetical protein [Bacilli bacterium]
MKKYKTIILITAILVIISLTLLVVSLIMIPKLEQEVDSNLEYVNVETQNMRYDNNFIWLNLDSVVSHLNGLNLEFYDGTPAVFEYVSDTVLREQVEHEYSAMIRYGNDEYVFYIKDPGTGDGYEGFGGVNYYTYNYFTVNGELFRLVTNNIFYAENDPSYLLDNSEQDINNFRIAYIDENLKPIQFWINFLSTGFILSIIIGTVCLSTLIFYSRRLYFFSGFETVELAKEHYTKLKDLKLKKRIIDNKKKVEDKHRKKLEELEKLEVELHEPNND